MLEHPSTEVADRNSEKSEAAGDETSAEFPSASATASSGDLEKPFAVVEAETVNASEPATETMVSDSMAGHPEQMLPSDAVPQKCPGYTIRNAANIELPTYENVSLSDSVLGACLTKGVEADPESCAHSAENSDSSKLYKGTHQQQTATEPTVTDGLLEGPVAGKAACAAQANEEIERRELAPSEWAKGCAENSADQGRSGNLPSQATEPAREDGTGVSSWNTPDDQSDGREELSAEQMTFLFAPETATHEPDAVTADSAPSEWADEALEGLLVDSGASGSPRSQHSALAVGAGAEVSRELLVNFSFGSLSGDDGDELELIPISETRGLQLPPSEETHQGALSSPFPAQPRPIPAAAAAHADEGIGDLELDSADGPAPKESEAVMLELRGLATELLEKPLSPPRQHYQRPASASAARRARPASACHRGSGLEGSRGAERRGDGRGRREYDGAGGKQGLAWWEDEAASGADTDMAASQPAEHGTSTHGPHKDSLPAHHAATSRDEESQAARPRRRRRVRRGAGGGAGEERVGGEVGEAPAETEKCRGSAEGAQVQGRGEGQGRKGERRHSAETRVRAGNGFNAECMANVASPPRLVVQDLDDSVNSSPEQRRRRRGRRGEGRGASLTSSLSESDPLLLEQRVPVDGEGAGGPWAAAVMPHRAAVELSVQAQPRPNSGPPSLRPLPPRLRTPPAPALWRLLPQASLSGSLAPPRPRHVYVDPHRPTTPGHRDRFAVTCTGPGPAAYLPHGFADPARHPTPGRCVFRKAPAASLLSPALRAAGEVPAPGAYQVRVPAGAAGRAMRCMRGRRAPAAAFGQEARVCCLGGGLGIRSKHEVRKADRVRYDDIRVTPFREWH